MSRGVCYTFYVWDTHSQFVLTETWLSGSKPNRPRPACRKAGSSASSWRRQERRRRSRGCASPEAYAVVLRICRRVKGFRSGEGHRRHRVPRRIREARRRASRLGRRYSEASHGSGSHLRGGPCRNRISSAQQCERAGLGSRGVCVHFICLRRASRTSAVARTAVRGSSTGSCRSLFDSNERAVSTAHDHHRRS